MKKITVVLGLAVLMFVGTIQVANAGSACCESQSKAATKTFGKKAAACASTTADAAKAGLTATGSKTCVVEGKNVECTVWSDGSCSPADKAAMKAACAHEGDCTTACAPATMKAAACSHEGECTTACAPAATKIATSSSSCAAPAGKAGCAPGSCSAPGQKAAKKATARKSS